VANTESILATELHSLFSVQLDFGLDRQSSTVCFSYRVDIQIKKFNDNI
jgi:hypothetical protein